MESMQLHRLAERVADVARRTLGISPLVITGPLVDGESPMPLDFRSEKLAKTGLSSLASLDDEVSNTLLAAQTAFGHAAHG
jgi:hypothetical protein